MALPFTALTRSLRTTRPGKHALIFSSSAVIAVPLLKIEIATQATAQHVSRGAIDREVRRVAVALRELEDDFLVVELFRLARQQERHRPLALARVLGPEVEGELVAVGNQDVGGAVEAGREPARPRLLVDGRLLVETHGDLARGDGLAGAADDADLHLRDVALDRKSTR